LISKADEHLVHQTEKPLAEADINAFGFDQHCRFQINGETGYGIVECTFTGGSRRYGIPRMEMTE